ncbi:MAG: acyl-CoA thioesterase domain-containing protein [Syntrophales bacterium]
MTPTHSSAVHPHDHAIRDRVLRAIAANRIPGVNFPGHLLDIEWLEVAGGNARAKLTAGPHCSDTNGALNIVAMGILADNMLAAVARTGTPPGARLGTIHLQLQFTGEAAVGDIDAVSHLLGRTEGAALQQLMTQATLSAKGKPVCHASGEYSLLDPPPGVTLGPLPWERTEPAPVSPVDHDTLTPPERTILEASDTALAKATGLTSFIQYFWGGVPRSTAQGASNRVMIGPHIANRVGHVQGGILIGLAAANACAAAPSAMMLSNLSAWYISPGRGTALGIRSRVLHAGRTITVVRTEIKTAGGRRVLEAVSNHAARSRR